MKILISFLLVLGAYSPYLEAHDIVPKTEQIDEYREYLESLSLEELSRLNEAKRRIETEIYGLRYTLIAFALGIGTGGLIVGTLTGLEKAKLEPLRTISISKLKFRLSSAIAVIAILAAGTGVTILTWDSIPTPQGLGSYFDEESDEEEVREEIRNYLSNLTLEEAEEFILRIDEAKRKLEKSGIFPQ